MWEVIRHKDQSVVLKHDDSDEIIEIKILKVSKGTKGRVTLGFDVPKGYAIRRKEKYEAQQLETL